MLKFIRRTVLILTVLVVLAVLMRNTIGTWIAESALEKATGFSVKIESLDIKWTFTHVSVKGVTVLNPINQYKERRAMTIGLLDASFDPFSFLYGEPHFKELTIDIPEVVAVRNANSEINLKRLQNKNGNQATSSKKLKIDGFVLSLGKVVYIDEKREPPKTMIYQIDAKNRVYQNISSSQDIKKLVMNLVIESLPHNLLGLGVQVVDENIKDARELMEKGKTAVDNLDKQSKGIFKFLRGDKEKSDSTPPGK